MVLCGRGCLPVSPDETKLRFLDHLERMARLDKAYAWWASKNYAAMLPEWADLPELLTERMNAPRSKS